MNALSIVLVGLGFWLIIDGVLSIIKYSKQSFPEQLIRAIRATIGIIIIVIVIVQNYPNHVFNVNVLVELV